MARVATGIESPRRARPMGIPTGVAVARTGHQRCRGRGHGRLAHELAELGRRGGVVQAGPAGDAFGVGIGLRTGPGDAVADGRLAGVAGGRIGNGGTGLNRNAAVGVLGRVGGAIELAEGGAGIDAMDELVDGRCEERLIGLEFGVEAAEAVYIMVGGGGFEGERGQGAVKSAEGQSCRTEKSHIAV